MDALKTRLNNFFTALMVSVAAFLFVGHIQAGESPITSINTSQSFEEWLENFKQQALQSGIQPAVLDQALNNIQLDQDVLRLDKSQPEFSKTIWQYIDSATSSQRLLKGRRLLNIHRSIFSEIERKYGVPREIITAIWAMESDFGANYGNKNVIRSLATLAYHGKRADFARQELLSALRIVQTRHASARELVGSWAGAMGQAQFIPSSYLKYAVDYNQDGKYDLWKTLPDVFASIANFLAESGWRSGQEWGYEVSLPKNFDWKLNVAAYELRMSEWQKLGLRLTNNRQINLPDANRQARLFVPAGKTGPVFLVTHNFNVIRRYNKSDSYALSVAQLSRLFSGGDRIKAPWPRQDYPLTYTQKEEIQTLLSLSGFDVGKIDGKIGEITQQAIQAWQISQGLAGDGYANLDLLNKLRWQDDRKQTKNHDL